MNKINLLLFTFCFFVSSSVFASSAPDLEQISYKNKFLEIKINYVKDINLAKVQNTLKILQQATLNPYILNNLDSLSVDVNILEKSNKVSLSNAEKKCKISLNYDNKLQGVLINPYEDDLIFTYFHEISHCMLGKNIFREGLKWEPSLNLNKDKIQEKNDKIELLTEQTTVQEQCFHDCVAINVFKKPPPLVVYHEMFADTMGIYFFQQYDCKNARKVFKEIENLRFDNYAKDKVKNMHQSFRVFNYINAKEFCNKKIDFREISFYTQQGFLDYLDDLE